MKRRGSNKKMKLQLPSAQRAPQVWLARLAGSGKSQQLGYIKPQMADVDLSSALLPRQGLFVLLVPSVLLLLLLYSINRDLDRTRARIREIPPRPAIGSTERDAACVKLASGRKAPRRTMISKSQGSLHALCFVSVSFLFSFLCVSVPNVHSL